MDFYPAQFTAESIRLKTFFKVDQILKFSPITTHLPPTLSPIKHNSEKTLNWKLNLLLDNFSMEKSFMSIVPENKPMYFIFA